MTVIAETRHGRCGALALGGSGAFIFSQRLSVSDILENGVVVLPFESLAGVSEYDYICNGLSSEIRSALAQNSKLPVQILPIKRPLILVRQIMRHLPDMPYI